MYNNMQEDLGEPLFENEIALLKLHLKVACHILIPGFWHKQNWVALMVALVLWVTAFSKM